MSNQAAELKNRKNLLSMAMAPLSLLGDDKNVVDGPYDTELEKKKKKEKTNPTKSLVLDQRTICKLVSFYRSRSALLIALTQY